MCGIIIAHGDGILSYVVQFGKHNCVSISPVRLHYRYSVKVINPNRKSSFAVQKLQATRTFTSVAEIREELSAFLKSDIKEVGYIETGHGAKGKLHYLQITEDLEETYGCYIGKHVDILLWC